MRGRCLVDTSTKCRMHAYFGDHGGSIFQATRRRRNLCLPLAFLRQRAVAAFLLENRRRRSTRARGPFSPRARFRFGVGLSSSVRPQEAASPFSRGCESSEGCTVDHPWQYLRPKILVSKSDQNNVKRSAKLESDDDKIRRLSSKISTESSAAGLKYRTLK